LGPGGRSFPADHFVEVALLPARGFVLHQQRKVIVIEFLEPFIPLDGLQ
jgi:hypothetical protein